MGRTALRHSWLTKPSGSSLRGALHSTSTAELLQHSQVLQGPAKTHLFFFRRKTDWQSTILQPSSQGPGVFRSSPKVQQDGAFPRVPRVLFWVMTQIKSCRHSLCRQLHHLGARAGNTTGDVNSQTCILTPAGGGRTKKAFGLEMSGQQLKTTTAESSVWGVCNPVKS